MSVICIQVSNFSYGSALLYSLSLCFVHMNNIWNNRNLRYNNERMVSIVVLLD